MATQAPFKFQEGTDVFTPKDLVELARPGAGVANQAGDLVLIPLSKYSFEEKQNKKTIYIAPLESTVKPYELPLAKSGEAFWLSGTTIAHVVEGENKTLDLYTINVIYIPASDNGTVATLQSESPKLVGSFPANTATNFRYSRGAGRIVFSDYVYSDGKLSTVKEQDEAWENRGNTALVYDSTFVRHWDTWVGPKTQSLFSVRLWQDPARDWHFGPDFVNLLEGTRHSSPVEPFGGTDDFDVSDQQVIYTSKDPELDEAWHTKQNIYIVDIAGGSKPRELTSGKQGATHSPVFNYRGTKVAWTELDEDGYESDRFKIVIYDLKENVRFTLTQKWDRSADQLAFAKEGDFIYFTAGDHARIKIFVLPIPPTPSESTEDPDLAHKYTTPVALTHEAAASGIQTLDYGRLLFTKSSLTSPNDVFYVRGLREFQRQIEQSESTVEFKGSIEQITKFTEDALKEKNLSKGEEFWFKGAHDVDVQGWTLKPKGWKKDEKKKWPVVLLIHGGPQGAWEDQWSTRWNPNGKFFKDDALFAQQGYFTVLINPTGSTTFGQNFTDAIAGDWGGRPFDDMVKGWKYVLEHHPEIDPDRAVAAVLDISGQRTSVSWIQGHPEFGFNFKALVCHDGVFDSNYNGYSTDELFFFNHEWGGRPWEKKSAELSQKYSPHNYVHKWSTPQLLIHGSKDYRLPDTEGIAAFHALQQLGVPSRLVIFPDENHWVLNHGNSLKWHYEVFRWFDQFVGKDKAE
uniref:Dipeptidyl-peptidase V n=1 Tax=Moniliophthora roreri TaxID=221103 RepID=A0A0W0FUP7_MONRR